jgi:hypothetical protein
LRCPGETKKRGAGRSTPALSVIFRVKPPSVVGRGSEDADTFSFPKADPKPAAIDWGASPPRAE